jgi:acyl-CoA synthetase (AMP-forming)/AMP-acid ligase II/acyl carrier protein
VYTSGSTGQPKGVEVTHANLQHLIEWHQRAFLITPLDRASQVAGLAFDAAVWEIWCHLAVGASLHLIDEASRRSPEALQQWLVAREITVAFVPTILAEYLITFDWPKNAALRILLTGADTLRRYPKPGLPFTLINNYGPTECTVLVTSGAVRGGMDGEQLPSIGNPIADTDILILDAQMNETRKGDEGEICAAGPQVARGYHNLPLLTAERFIHVNGRRVYRTGDLGRVLPDGQIAFAGRMDDQIKIRGFRIEPDEVAAHLNGHPGIRNSVVTARADEAGEKTLAGYVVPMPGATLSSAELREYLRLHLPEYMIPVVFVSVSALPVTTTGKCDRQALPVPSMANLLRESLEDERKEQATQSKTEMRIAELVSGLMDGKPISRDDNFFLVGGHSLLAAQLIARVRESMAVSLNLRQLFEAPTIGSLAAVVEQQLAAR